MPRSFCLPNLLTAVLLPLLVSAASAQETQNEEVLFFYSNENGDGWRFHDLNSGESNFWNLGGEISGASISPDGLQVAYSAGDSIFISDIEGQNITPLVTGLTEDLTSNPRPRPGPRRRTVSPISILIYLKRN